MNSDPSTTAEPSHGNLPNQITAARIMLAIVMFFTLHFGQYGSSLALFVVAAGTDWLDGYLARSRNQVTQLGRILDPLADKLIISGTFIFLAAVPGSGIPAWLTVVVVGRELIVTVVRSFLEQRGHDFSANMPGKLKMVFQCGVVIASLSLLWLRGDGLGGFDWLATVVLVLMLLAAASTVYSGVLYMAVAARLLREP
jgi:CDP-diacylglycerol--glycerol-3-phosphate 3-phosphatidyltransferase